MDPITLKLLRESAEGREVIQEISEEAVAPLNQEIESLTEKNQTLSSDLSEKTKAAEEANTKLKELEEEHSELKNQVSVLKSVLGSMTVKEHFNDLVSKKKQEIKEKSAESNSKPDFKIVDLVIEEFESFDYDSVVVVGDDDKYESSKAKLSERFDKTYENLKKLSERFKTTQSDDSQNTVVSSSNSTSACKAEDFFSSEVYSNGK